MISAVGRLPAQPQVSLSPLVARRVDPGHMVDNPIPFAFADDGHEPRPPIGVIELSLRPTACHEFRRHGPRVVASLSHHRGIGSGHVTEAVTAAVRVLLEFVVEHIREPSGGKSCAC